MVYLHQATPLYLFRSDGITGPVDYLVYPGKVVQGRSYIKVNVPTMDGDKALYRPPLRWYLNNIEPLTDLNADKITLVPTKFFYKNLSISTPEELLVEFIRCMLVTEYLYDDDDYYYGEGALKVFPYEDDTDGQNTTDAFERKCHLVFNCRDDDVCVVNTPALRDLFNKNAESRQLIIKSYRASEELMTRLGCTNCFEQPRVHHIEIYD